MLYKRLICLSLIVTTLFISNRSSAMVTTTATGLLVFKVTLVGGTVIVAASPAIVAAGGFAVVGGACYGAYRFFCPSKATSEAERKMNEKFAELEKKVADSEKAREKESEASKQVLTLVQSLLDQVSADRKKADEKSNEWLTLRILKNAIPAGLRQKIKLASDASVDAIKMGSIAAWKFTCKDHPYTTITCMLLPAGYVFYRKYGKDIREACTRQFTSEERALMKTHAIDIEPKK